MWAGGRCWAVEVVDSWAAYGEDCGEKRREEAGEGG